jgi:hypothetical protein
MKDVSIFDVRQHFIPPFLNLWRKSVRLCGAFPAWITARAARTGPAPASSAKHLGRLHPWVRRRVSFPPRHRAPLSLRLPNRPRRPSARLASQGEVPVRQTFFSPILPAAPNPIRPSGRLDGVSGSLGCGNRATSLAHFLSWCCDRVLKNGPPQRTRWEPGVSGKPWQPPEGPRQWSGKSPSSAFLRTRSLSRLVIRPLPTDCASPRGEGGALAYRPAGVRGRKSPANFLIRNNTISIKGYKYNDSQIWNTTTRFSDRLFTSNSRRA